MRIFFGITTTQLVLSLLCSIFLFIQFATNREWRHRKNNHILLVLLILTFLQNTIEAPMNLIYLRTGVAANTSSGFCLFWILSVCSLNGTGILLMTFASIERYMFIYHNTILNRHSILLRYIPITLCFIYPLLYFIGIILLLPCHNQFIYFAYLCSGGCYVNDPFWNTMTWVGNISLPIFIILFINVLLITRTIYQKNKMKQTHVWLKNRKMVLQLVSIAALYCFTWLPSAILISIVTLHPPNVNTSQIFFIFQYVVLMTNFTPLFYPFVCLAGQPFILNKIKRIYQRGHPVVPIQLAKKMHGF
ncbi:unnamed protein product [Adineta steineri]|uniref:G-protein coupled receptors family 1 profile domain-containing protein n=1 Tax=Adineta steineri TaxID=433720 RepID=A0A818ZHU5_9BILA|nr:unnamed protein product [Adineta steineri]CAF3765166.1 unnamed protein product [Adineta steineri]